MKVVVLGPKGTYSYQVAKKFFFEEDIILVSSFKKVIEYSLKEKVKAIVPIENSIIGSIKEVEIAMRGNNFIVENSFSLPVEHCLLGNFITEDLSQVKYVYSQENAIKQCGSFISQNLSSAYQIFTTSTALGAKRVSENGKLNEVAIGSLFTANEYNLKVIKVNIQDDLENFTKFVLISPPG